MICPIDSISIVCSTHTVSDSAINAVIIYPEDRSSWRMDSSMTTVMAIQLRKE